MPSKAKVVIIASVAIATAIGYWAWSRAGASEPKGDGKRAQVVPVKTATVDVRSIPIQIRAIGQVEASSTVNVNPQVGGQITRIDFQEGDVVRKGQVLFNIDPRVSQTDVAQADANYQRALATASQAQANLAKDQATARNAGRRATLCATRRFRRGLALAVRHGEDDLGDRGSDRQGRPGRGELRAEGGCGAEGRARRRQSAARVHDGDGSR